MTIRFTKEILLICEGKSDKAFFEAFLTYLNLAKKIQVEESGGYTEFANFLDRFTANLSSSIVKNILIIGDVDDDKEAKFNEVQQSLDKIKANKNIEASIMLQLIPFSGLGALETMILPSLYKTYSLEKEINNLQNQSPAQGWNVSKKSKMEIQCIFAATCQKQPDITLANIFQSSKNYPFNFDHECFYELKNFLKDFVERL